MISKFVCTSRNIFISLPPLFQGGGLSIWMLTGKIQRQITHGLRQITPGLVFLVTWYSEVATHNTEIVLLIKIISILVIILPKGVEECHFHDSE